ncbi:ODFP1 protein, partial [Neodrepanis coruscans]|nr:ODFP1 protein [Neodrepanis coruscans]
SRMQRLGRVLTSSLSQSRLALIDVKDFDPDDVSVVVKDRKVTVLAEHRDDCCTSMAKTHRYRKFVKEFNLPPGVNEDDVTCSL